MKRVTIIVLCTFYLFAVSGVRLGVHYCHGHFQAITFHASFDEDTCCGRKRPMKKSGCCSDKVIEIEIKSEQKIAYSPTFPGLNKVALVHFSDNHSKRVLCLRTANAVSPIAHAPPYAQTIPVHILNRTYRI